MLEASGVTKDFIPPFSFGDIARLRFRRGIPVRALDNISFSLPKGKILAILGPNGAGKTTLLKIISTLILPDTGSVKVNGLTLGKDDDRIKANIGLVASSETTFYWRLTGRQNLEFFAAMYGLDKRSSRKRIAELFKLFEVDYQDKRYDSYSMGMKQRFALIRSLIHDPELVLFDEPSKSLDYNATRWLADFIKDRLVKDGGKTVVFTTHRMDEADELADSFLMLHRGRSLAGGNLEDLQRLSGRPGATLSRIYTELTMGERPC